ncbi:serine/threonine-protein kinase pim-1 isoform X1 [Oryzias melastigma]|uniref:non-specific serine/threonine protein kinase n=1 Tax=Oryzias melastigma TaxID=30732 RepID=A0A3B3BJB5_ORYME|nr:serine/threonine-protein kinase pim-1 isoform X1 [Oryzias melastigma]
MVKNSAKDNPKCTDSSSKTRQKPFDNKQTKKVERKPKSETKKQKKKVKFLKPRESPEPEPTRPSTSTQDNPPVRGLKRKRQEDQQEEEIIEPKKRRPCLKASSSSAAQQSSKTFSDDQTKEVKRKPKPEPKKKKKKVKHCEQTESDIGQDNTRVRGLKRKRQEDEDEDTRDQPKIMKPSLKSYQELRDLYNKMKGNKTSGQEKTLLKSSANEKESNQEIPIKKTERDDVIDQKAEFEAKYVEEDQFGSGGFGSIHAGFRRSDNLPVAIKHILKCYIRNKELDENGNFIPSEVAILLKLRDESLQSKDKAAPVPLLDWYEIGREVILVMERPIPCEDMYDYIENKGGKLQEEEAKIIMKQLIHTAIDLEERNIFHQDIKIDNILIQTSSDVPRARLIDFGLSCMAEKDTIFRVFSGTPAHGPPEYFKGFSSPGSTTVWQLGVVLYESLHDPMSFSTRDFVKGSLTVHDKLSEECQDFFRACLNLNQERRAQLKDLLHHPWLR